MVRALAERRDLRRALHVIDERGQWASGGEAMLRALERVPALRPWVRLARRPPLVGLVEPGYRWFARHRARFSWLASPGWSPRGGPGPYSAPRSASVGESRAARIAG